MATLNSKTSSCIPWKYWSLEVIPVRYWLTSIYFVLRKIRTSWRFINPRQCTSWINHNTEAYSGPQQKSNRKSFTATGLGYAGS